jgi:hypothetical protein
MVAAAARLYGKGQGMSRNYMTKHWADLSTLPVCQRLARLKGWAQLPTVLPYLSNCVRSVHAVQKQQKKSPNELAPTFQSICSWNDHHRAIS